MNILQAHKYYWHRDGASNYMLFLSELLEKEGNQVIPFSMKNSKNLDSEYARFFVSNADLSVPETYPLSKKLGIAGRMMYSFEARKKIEALLATDHVDVAHLHNIYHHISPSILPELKKRGVKIVMTLHDYKLICPNYTMYHNGNVQEKDCKGWYGHCLRSRCMQGSLAKSAIVTTEMIFHHKIMRYYERYVDKFIAPSKFMMNMCVKYGWPKAKFVHMPNPIDIRRFSPSKVNGDYVAYLGRLSEEKGLKTLLKAAQQLPDIPFKIIGTGPLEKVLKAYKKEHAVGNVEFTGFKTGKELDALIDHARLFVVPSEWYENYPLSILEPKAKGRIVLGTKIGGIPELLPEELLVKPHNVHDLVQHIDAWFNSSQEKRERLGSKLRQEVETVNDPEDHVKQMLKLYESL